MCLVGRLSCEVAVVWLAARAVQTCSAIQAIAPVTATLTSSTALSLGALVW